MLPSLAPELHSSDRLPFVRRLVQFLEDHGFDNVPTLVLQCDVEGMRLQKLDSQELSNAIRSGAGETYHGDWWQGFVGGNTLQVFDGLASRESSREPKWATELHEDGHVLAAIRLVAFEQLGGVHTNILNSFQQFGLLVQRLHSAAAVSGTLRFTASLVNCKGLGMLGAMQYGQPQVRNLGRDFFEWPVLHAEKAEDGKAVCEQMRLRMARLFP